MTILKGYDLPPGFRFHPTDEELIVHYLINQTKSRSCPVPIIPEVDIYKFDPWELPAKSQFGEKEWYFFSPRDRKYPNGARPNRATTSGYWKATGTDKAIYSASKYVGVKKALVFYKGRPPKGIKTDWIMHEYRLGSSSPQQKRSDGSMRLDEWVLCRIYKKKQMGRPDMETTSESPGYSMPSLAIKGDDRDEQSLPRPMSLSSLLDVDFSTMSYILNDDLFGSMNGAQTGAYTSTGSGGGSSTDRIQSQAMEQAHFNYNMNQNLLYPQRNFL